MLSNLITAVFIGAVDLFKAPKILVVLIKLQSLKVIKFIIQLVPVVNELKISLAEGCGTHFSRLCKYYYGKL